MGNYQYGHFFDRIETDPRIRVTHIAVFAAIYFLWMRSGYENRIKVFSEEVMKIAKISSRITYCKAIIDLNEYGYVTYCPSFFRRRGSTISLIHMSGSIPEGVVKNDNVVITDNQKYKSE